MTQMRFALLVVLVSAVAGFGTPRASDWSPLPLTVFGQGRGAVTRVSVSAIDPSYLIATTADPDLRHEHAYPVTTRLYRTFDSGETWENIVPWIEGEPAELEATELWCDPRESSWVWAAVRYRSGSASYMRHSTDHGATWSVYGSLIRQIEDWLPDPELPGHGLVLTGDLRLVATTDDGATWQELYGGTYVGSSVARSPVDRARVLAVGSDISLSTDLGETWETVFSGVEYAERSFWSDDGATVRVLTYFDVITSTDAGATWVSDPLDLDRYSGSWIVAADPSRPEFLAGAELDLSHLTPVATCCGYGYSGDLHTSHDNGKSWGVERTTEGHEWLPRNHNVGDLEIRDGKLWATFPDIPNGGCTLVRSTDAGASWHGATSGLAEQHVRALNVGADGRIYAWPSSDRPGLVAVSSDGGHNWASATAVSTTRSFTVEASELASGLCFAAGTRWVPGYLGPVVGLSTDGGQSFTDVEPPPWNAISLGRMNHGNGDALYFVSEDRSELVRTQDRGQTYDPLVALPFAPEDLVISPENDDEIIAVTDSGAPVRHSTDGGVTWRSISRGLPLRPVRTVLMNPRNSDHLAVVYETGSPWESFSRGASWRPVGTWPGSRSVGPPEERPFEEPDPLAGVEVRAAAWDPSGTGRARFFLLTGDGVWDSRAGFLPAAGRGDLRHGTAIAWSAPTGQVLVGGIGILARAVAPPVPAPGGSVLATPVWDVARRLTVAPNPFRDATRLDLSLPAAADASVRIYDVHGRLVRTLLNERSPAGLRQIRWDARSDDHRLVAPGVYFVRWTLGEGAGSERLVRLR